MFKTNLSLKDLLYDAVVMGCSQLEFLHNGNIVLYALVQIKVQIMPWFLTKDISFGRFLTFSFL